MKTEDIVEAINIDLKRCRRNLNIDMQGHFILQRNIDVDASFKTYKTYSIKLWYSQSKKNVQVILEDSITDKVLNNDDSKIIRLLNISFLSKFLEFNKSKKWIEIVNYGIPNIK